MKKLAITEHSSLFRDKGCVTIDTIEIGLDRAPFVVFVYFFPHLKMQKTAVYGPQQH